jgi:hypothetical protein
MNADKLKQKLKEKYRGLLMSDTAKELLEREPEAFKKCCNGVGSRVGFWNRLLYHFIPDTILFLNITCCSDLHDVDFTFPKVFKTDQFAKEHFHKANQRFLNNLEIHVLRQDSWNWLEERRLWRARKYFEIVDSEKGWQSYIDGRRIINA